MKWTWRRTPELWAVPETAALYARMAARGWMLESRGQEWDRYRRAEPQKLRFWLEFTARRRFDGPEELPEEKIHLYEECGWKLVAHNGQVYVFAAPATQALPAPYDAGDPQEDAMLRCVQASYRSEMLSMAVALVLAAVWLLCWRMVPVTRLIQGWWWMAFWLLMMIRSVTDNLYGFAAAARLRKRSRAGTAMTPSRHLGFRIPRAILGGLGTLCLLVGVMELVLSWQENWPVPAHSDGNYLVLSETLDAPRVPDEEAQMAVRQEVNWVDLTYALPVYRVWDTNEVVDYGGTELRVWQQSYQLRWPSLAAAVATSLRQNSTFADKDAYRQVDIAGLDGAWYVPGGMEYVALAGNRVVYATVIGEERDDSLLLRLLEETAALWAQ